MNRTRRRRKNIHLKQFGININQYSLMLKEQNGLCYICNEKDDKGELAVDHCHETGAVRGLLCRNCNNGLGRFKDDIERLEKAIEYLKRDYTVPHADDFDEYIEHEKRARWKVKVTTPEKSFSSIAEAAKYYNVHETTVHGWLGKLKSRPHLKKDGWEYEKVFTA